MTTSKFGFVGLITICTVLVAQSVWSQPPSGGYSAPAEQTDVTPVNNSLPNPYATETNFGTLPDGQSWGAVSAIHVDIDGEHIWVAHRCGANSCIGSDVDPIVLLAPSGEVVRSFGAGIFSWPHGMDVDARGNLWVTDARGASVEQIKQYPEAFEKGHAVYKFSPQGELLLTLGTPGRAGKPPRMLSEPSDVLIAPDGSIFIAEAHRAQFEDEAGGANAYGRISKFSADASYVAGWGEFGFEAGQFRTPHALEMDSQGRLFVADRGNRRLQIFDQEGMHLDTWYQFSRVSGLYIDGDDRLYAIDSESSEKYNPGWRKGLRIGNAKTGDVEYFVPEHFLDETIGLGGFGAMGEGVTVDANGTIYTGEIGPDSLRGVTRYIPKLEPISD